MQDFKAKMQKIRCLMGTPDAFLDPAGELTALPWPTSWCGGVNPLPKNPISFDSSGLAFARPQYPRAQHLYLKILSYGPASSCTLITYKFT